MVRNEAVLLQSGEVSTPVADEMVSVGILGLTGETSPHGGWQKIFKPHDVVGIKVNALGGRNAATRAGVVAAVISGLKRAGSIREENIIVWDRLTEELSTAGYTINRSGRGVQCFGTDKDYDPYPAKRPVPSEAVSAPLFLHVAPPSSICPCSRTMICRAFPSA